MAVPVFVADEVVAAAKINLLPKGTVAYAEKTADQASITTETTVTGLTFTGLLVTGRLYRFTVYGHGVNGTVTSTIIRIKDDGATVLESVINNVTGTSSVLFCQGLLTGNASSTYTVTVTPGAGSLTWAASATRRSFLIAEDVGAA